MDTMMKSFDAIKELTMQEASKSGNLTRGMKMLEKEISDIRGSNGVSQFDNYINNQVMQPSGGGNYGS